MHQIKDRLSNGIFKKKKAPSVCCLQETHFKYKDASKIKVWKKTYHAGAHQQIAGVATLPSDKTKFKARKIIRDQHGYYRVIKGSIIKTSSLFKSVAIWLSTG